jgi:hypothetical protein
VEEVPATGAKTAMSHKTVTSGKNQGDDDEPKGRRSKNNGDSKI